MKKARTNQAVSRLAFAFAAALMVGAVQATTYYVSPNGDDSDGTSWAKAFKTAEKGFNAVHNKNTAGLELVIAPGVYDLKAACACAGGTTEAKRVIVRGETGNPNDVVLDAKGQFECLRISQHVTVSGLTVSNGINRSGCAAGGIRFAGGSPSGAEFNSIVSNCVVTCCTNTFTDTGNNGAAVVMSYSDLLVKSIVRNNTAKARGAGVLMINNQNNTSSGRGPKMKGCCIEGNESKNSGAGVYVASYSEMSSILGGLKDVEIENCEIVNNVSQEGGAGVYCTDNLDLRIKGCNISSNVGVVAVCVSRRDCLPYPTARLRATLPVTEAGLTL